MQGPLGVSIWIHQSVLIRLSIVRFDAARGSFGWFHEPTVALPLGIDALLFCREVLGAVAAAKPSGVFRTGWPTNDQMRSCGVAQLGVSIESEVQRLCKRDSRIECRLLFGINGGMRVSQDFHVVCIQTDCQAYIAQSRPRFSRREVFFCCGPLCRKG